MTDQAAVRNVTINFDQSGTAVSLEAIGLLTNDERYWHPGSIWTLPTTFGHTDLIVDGDDIGAVRTPYRGSRAQLLNPPGIAVVSRFGQVSVAVQLAPEGAVRLALKLMDEVMSAYGRTCADDSCPPKLRAAYFALHDAEYECRTAREPLR